VLAIVTLASATLALVPAIVAVAAAAVALVPAIVAVAAATVTGGPATGALAAATAVMVALTLPSGVPLVAGTGRMRVVAMPRSIVPRLERPVAGRGQPDVLGGGRKCRDLSRLRAQARDHDPDRGERRAEQQRYAGP
jgi:hypothetical protein